VTSSIRRSASLALAVVLSILAATVAAAGEPRRIALAYDEALKKADFPNPVVRMRIGNRPVWLLVDTGAGVHLLASWFVKAAGLPIDEALGKEVSGVDATGQEMAFRGVRNVRGLLDDGSTLELALAAVADFAPDFEKANVAGAISPQLLAGAGEAAAMDLRIPELRLEPFAAAVARLGARVVTGDGLEICGSRSGPVPNLLFAIPVKVGAASGSLLLDTGARVTKLHPGSALTRGLQVEAKAGTGTGVTGVAQSYGLARDVRIELPGRVATVDARVAERGREVCGREGLLGLDAIGSCALVLASDRIAIACRP
jgi:hypothetical protein